MLEEIRQESLTDVAEAKIHTYLREKEFRPGDAFHGEKELAEMLGISRPVVREALSRFRMLGLLESRKRRGIVVSRPSVFKTLGKVLDPAFLSEEEGRDFINLRYVIELGMADFLAKNITDADLAYLDELVKREETAPEDFDLYMDCDFRFHARLYRASGNRALESFQVLLFRFFSDRETRLRQRRPDSARRFEDPEQTSHRDLLEAIKTRNPETIHRTVHKHLSIHLKGNPEA